MLSPLQVTWIYEPKEGDRMNIAVFHPKYNPNYPESPMKGRVSFSPSPPNLDSPSIQITDVRMTDEGKYICEYATYPSGNEQGITYLLMLGRSRSHVLCFNSWESQNHSNSKSEGMRRVSASKWR